MTARAPRPATLEDLLVLPEDEQKRFELVDGEIAERGATTGRHGRAQFRLSAFAVTFDRRSGGPGPGGWWFATEADIWFDAANTFKPDVAGWRRERVAEQPDEFPIRERPDWVCEILSTNRAHDLVRKKRVYHRYGVPHYWILDPVEGTLSVLRRAEEGYVEVLSAERQEVVRAEPFDAVTLHVGFLFGDEASPATE